MIRELEPTGAVPYRSAYLTQRVGQEREDCNFRGGLQPFSTGGWGPIQPSLVLFENPPFQACPALGLSSFGLWVCAYSPLSLLYSFLPALLCLANSSWVRPQGLMPSPTLWGIETLPSAPTTPYNYPIRALTWLL